MGLELRGNMNQEGGKRHVEKMMQTYGCLPSAADGPLLPTFQPKPLAAAIEQEIKRAGEYGWSKITLHMDIPDAVKLAGFLRGH